MSCSIKETLETRIDGSFDVIVAGGGPAGIGAALAAARRGMKTLLVERFGFLGGMWTTGLVNPVFEFMNKGGVLKEIIECLKENNAWGGLCDYCFSYEQMKTLLDEMICEAGITPLYHTMVTKCITEDNRAIGVITENKEGRNAYYARIVIDCTGDADVSVSAGADYFIGRDTDNKVQPMTLMFVIGNVKFNQNDRHHLYNLMKTAVDKYNKDYSIPYMYPWIINIPGGMNQAVVQLVHIRNLCGVNAFELTKAEIEGRKQVKEAVELFKNHIPELKDIELLYTAPHIGVRESRRIKGEYILDKDDLISGREFVDGIATSCFNMDIHNIDDTDHVLTKVKPYQIPYRCMIPKNLEGILVAGRCISGTHEALASYRVTGTCISMGEAAGIAAHLAITNNVGVRDISMDELKRQLLLS